MAWLMWWERVVFSGSERFSTLKAFSALAMPRAVRVTPGLFIDHVVGVDVVGLLFLVVHGGLHQALQTGGKIVRQGVQLGGLFPHTGDDQGVRASSMRMESTSSTMAKAWPRCMSSAL